MMRTLSVLIATLAVLVGCAGSPAWNSARISSTRSEAKKNNEKMMALEIGQSKQEVLELMGTPTKREAYGLDGGRTIEFLLYRTSGWSPKDLGDRDYQFTPVAFEDNTLVGWGRNYYNNVIQAAVDVIIKQ